MTAIVGEAQPVRAYVNHGRWVGECTEPDCANAEQLERGQALYHCSNCLVVAEVEWPDEAAAIWTVLQRRRVPQTRNWFPEGHPLALASGCPHGQSVADLQAENREHGVE